MSAPWLRVNCSSSRIEGAPMRPSPWAAMTVQRPHLFLVHRTLKLMPPRIVGPGAEPQKAVNVK
jgi:hypothetical protein